MTRQDFDQLLFRINKNYTQKINKNLSEFNITRTEMSFLLKIKENPEITQNRLAEMMDINTATVTRALERLEKKEVIIRSDDKKDKRKKTVLLTDFGKQIIGNILEKHEGLKKEVFGEFSDEEYLQLLNLLDKLSLSLKK